MSVRRRRVPVVVDAWAVAGAREYSNWYQFSAVMARAVRCWGPPDVILTLGTRGAGTMAESWAAEHGVRCVIIKKIPELMRRATHLVLFPMDGGVETQKLIDEEDERPRLVTWVGPFVRAQRGQTGKNLARQ